MIAYMAQCDQCNHNFGMFHDPYGCKYPTCNCKAALSKVILLNSDKRLSPKFWKSYVIGSWIYFTSAGFVTAGFAGYMLERNDWFNFLAITALAIILSMWGALARDSKTEKRLKDLEEKCGL